jgi:hypothetical protein
MKWKTPGSGDKDKRASTSGKTTHAGRTSSDDQTTARPSSGASRSSPEWPSRDQGRKVTYYTGGGKPEVSDRTQLFGPTKAEPASKVNALSDPVVGWLVIVEGPGKGRSFELGIGSNSLGRDTRQKIALNFGDEAIHRENHAMIIFDPKSRQFYIQAGNASRNLTYLGDELVIAATPLRGGEILLIGQTKLAFVAFCGPDFSWA